MKILVTNDDGIYAEGIRALAKALSFAHEVSVLAPDKERSAASHSMTFTSPLIPSKAKGYEGITDKAYMITGTPVDCVKVAADCDFIDNDFELVVSGINHGSNLGTDVLYSGTAGAALEGVIHGRCGIAFSIFSHKPRYVEQAAQYAAKMIDRIDFSALPEATALNVNFPDTPSEEFRGVAACELGIVRYDDEVVRSEHPNGFSYYWMSGEPNISRSGEDSDVMLIRRGFVTLSPIMPDLTARYAMGAAKSIASGLKL